MVLEKNSLVLVDYTARLKEGNVVIQSTRSYDPPESNAPGTVYRPKLVSIGNPAHPVERGFDAALADAQIGVPESVEVEPKNAYGEANSANVRMLTMRKLGENAEKVSVGDEITVDGKRGVIKFIGSGRVRIDFNHKYAGKTIVYDFIVMKKLETPTEIIKTILDDAGLLENEESFNLQDNLLEVIVPSKLFRKDDIQTKKYFLQREIFQFVPELEGIEFIDLHYNPVKPKPAPQSEVKDLEL